ncbi:GATA transcription factor 16 [Prunus dulcis]|uniref:GATA transcription factor 16 n=1 Tax=Prunus dulcis TaxID=3755 RepID=A0A4Y1RRY0_PRUDU|nr:GATA transcription factor 16 [Prunus dulcis]
MSLLWWVYGGMMNWGRRFVALDSVLGRKEPFPQAMNGNKKRCSDCMTTETPLWRGGPAGPKSLCNACGIRHRKRGIPTVSLMSKAPKRRKEKICGGSSSTITTTYNIAASANTIMLLPQQPKALLVVVVVA